MIWRTVHETPIHKYQVNRLTGRRRAVAKIATRRPPHHQEWLRGGEFRTRPKTEIAEAV